MSRLNSNNQKGLAPITVGIQINQKKQGADNKA